MKEVCRVEIANKTSVSDDQGQSSYEGMKFSRAPQGTFYFNFKDSENNTESEEYTTFLQTNVIKMRILSGDPPLEQTIGVPFSPQPELQVLDQNGNPVASSFTLKPFIFCTVDKKVVAFSWPEPQFSGPMTANLIEAGKFAWLSGDVSEASNASGIAKFKNLTVFIDKQTEYYTKNN